MMEILIAAGIMLVVSSVIIKSYREYLDSKRVFNVCVKNKEMFHIICEDIKYNLDMDFINTSRLCYISLRNDALSKIIDTPIENLLRDRCENGNYILVGSEEMENQYIFKLILYCNGDICEEKSIRRSKFIL